MKKPPQWRATIASGAVTLMALTITGSVLYQLFGGSFPFWKTQGGNQTDPAAGADTEIGGVSIADSLENSGIVISNEATLISKAACAEANHQMFEERKQRGFDFLAASDYEAAAALFQSAFSLCAAPEVLIARNNAVVADAEAHTLVFSVPFSGENSDNAVEMLRGAAQAQAEINSAGGINGVPLKLIVVDDGDSVDRARELAIAITDEAKHEDVLGVVGHWTSDVSLSAAAIYRDRQTTPFITPISTTKVLTGFSPWVYRATINNRIGAEAMARHMLDTWQLSKAAIFYVDGVTYSEEIRSEFESIVNAGKDSKIVAEYDLGDANFSPEQAVNDALAAGAEVILLATNNGSVPKALEVIKENVGRMKMLGDLANLYTPKTLTEVGNASEGLVMAIAWDADGRVNEAYRRDAQALWRGSVNYVSAMSYSSIKGVAAAIAQAPTRAGVQQALADESFEVQGASETPLRFERGDRQAPVQLVEVVRASNGSSSLDFKPIDPDN